MAILTGNSYTANHHLDLFANHGCGLLRGGVAWEFTRKSCIEVWVGVAFSLPVPTEMAISKGVVHVTDTPTSRG